MCHSSTCRYIFTYSRIDSSTQSCADPLGFGRVISCPFFNFINEQFIRHARGKATAALISGKLARDFGYKAMSQGFIEFAVAVIVMEQFICIFRKEPGQFLPFFYFLLIKDVIQRL